MTGQRDVLALCEYALSRPFAHPADLGKRAFLGLDHGWAVALSVNR